MPTSERARRQLIAQKSPIQRALDTRPRCESCGHVLTLGDHQNYWDGRDPHVEGCIPEGHSIVPRLCIDCCESEELEERERTLRNG